MSSGLAASQLSALQDAVDLLVQGEAQLQVGQAQGFKALAQGQAAFASVVQHNGKLSNSDELQKKVSDLLAQEKTLAALSENRQAIRAQLLTLQKLQEKLVAQLLPQSHGTEAVLVLTRQSWLAERLLGQLEGLLPVQDAAAWNAHFQKDLTLFAQVVQALKSGDDALRIPALVVPQDVQVLAEIQQSLKSIQQNAKLLSDQVTTAASIQQKAGALNDSIQSWVRSAAAIFGKTDVAGGGNRLSFWLGLALGLTGLGLLGLFGFQNYKKLTQNVSSTSEQHKANRDSVWRLLDELSTLAEGDLTVQATVGDDITGSIAESVNFAIGALRKLVVTIEETAQSVLLAVEQAQTTTGQLAEASQKQAQEISEVSGDISTIASSIEAVSENAKKSSEVAQNAVQVAQSGAMVVKNNLEGMGRAHTQIEQTAQKIKQLGDSSQEIGNIISLIDDLSDQTNIVALNAAIQAAMAGDAGRGFAVVADEIQRLAERSSQSAKQIEGLVRHIQKDVQQTIEAMQQTTTEVTTAAQLAGDAAASLERIDEISKELADHIQHISDAATQQAGSSSKASKTMQIIQEIVMQTASGSAAAASSVGEVLKMAEGLKRSVAGFKLPNKEVS